MPPFYSISRIPIHGDERERRELIIYWPNGLHSVSVFYNLSYYYWLQIQWYYLSKVVEDSIILCYRENEKHDDWRKKNSMMSNAHWASIVAIRQIHQNHRMCTYIVQRRGVLKSEIRGCRRSENRVEDLVTWRRFLVATASSE